MNTTITENLPNEDDSPQNGNKLGKEWDRVSGTPVSFRPLLYLLDTMTNSCCMTVRNLPVESRQLLVPPLEELAQGI